MEIFLWLLGIFVAFVLFVGITQLAIQVVEEVNSNVRQIYNWRCPDPISWVDSAYGAGTWMMAIIGVLLLYEDWPKLGITFLVGALILLVRSLHHFNQFGPYRGKIFIVWAITSLWWLFVGFVAYCVLSLLASAASNDRRG